MLRNFRNTLLCLLLLALLHACSKNDATPSSQILMVGYRLIQGAAPASGVRVWKNGVPSTISDTLNRKVVYSAALDGTTIYAAGANYTSKGPGAAYWKDGTLVMLDTTSVASTASCIFVESGNVHVGGYDANGFARYWKNGIEVPIEGGQTPTSQILAIAVAGSDVYLAGSSGSTAAWWKNGTLNKITEAGAQVTSIAATATDVYVGGQSGSPTPSGTYWKNGVKKQLGGRQVLAIAINGADVYFSGYYMYGPTLDQTACYWKNDTFFSIGSEQFAQAIAVDGNDVHILCGRDYYRNGVTTPVGASDARHTDYLKSIFVIR
ncbi:MAG: hypothetical protein K1X47_07975 [Cyclobacteriaceae bacterium]|nr:hypothetical protein [Cyclobacteriaceae bacterium]